MSVTPFRDAAAATVAEARRRHESRGPRDPVSDIANRMDLDVTEVVMVGFGDMRDLGTDVGVSADVVLRVLASPLASFLLTVCGGRLDVAESMLGGALMELRKRSLERLYKAETEGIAATVSPAEPWGRA